jgi:hypothetical protein
MDPRDWEQSGRASATDSAALAGKTGTNLAEGVYDSGDAGCVVVVAVLGLVSSTGDGVLPRGPGPVLDRRLSVRVSPVSFPVAEKQCKNEEEE